MQILQALSLLDPENNDHWTADGLPRLDQLSKLSGAKFTRKDVTNADPEFNREKASLEKAEANREKSRQARDTEGEAKLAADIAAKEEEISKADPVEEDTAPEPEPAYAVEAKPEFPVEGFETLNLPPDQLIKDPELMAKFLAESSEVMNEARKQQNQIKNLIESLSAKSEIISKIHERAVGPAETSQDHIRRYLKGQQEVNTERVKRAQDFIRSGTNAKDVLQQMTPGSRLDQALNKRRAAPGTQRPENFGKTSK